MQAKTDRTAILLVGGLIALLVCCLVLTVAGGLGAVWALVQTRGTTDRIPSDTPAPLPTPLTQGGETVTVPPEAEAMRLVLAQALVPIADPLSLAERLSGIENPPVIASESAAPIALGTEQTFWATNLDSNENFQVRARLVYATPHVYFWVDRDVDVDEDEVSALVDTFEENSYPTVRAFFGSEWSPGVDGDVHLYILYASGLGSGIAGYYSSKDELSPVVHEFSNGHEMFFINSDTQVLSGSFADGVLAHEFQHMIHWYRDRNEDTWMNEGFSEVAAFLNGFYLGGWDAAYADDSDLPLTFWPGGGESQTHYGQAFLFLVYFLDRFGHEATQSVVADPANGLDSIDQVLATIGATDPATGDPIDADDVYRDWAVAMLLQDPSVAEGQFAIESYPGAPSVSVNDRIDNCPIERVGREVSQYGMDFIELDCRGDFTLTFQGAARVGIVPAEAYSGDYTFWSNRGDESDMTLTRAFDLRSVAAPIEFTYRTWFDLEEDYDYVYLEVSTDGGETWDILTTPSGTSEDPSGNSYGWGYNGTSGGGEAEWIEERIDLSEFAGQEVLLRFEYVTDAAVNGEGLMLDDIHLEAIGYAADFEQDEAGWTAEGFVRLYNLLPQTYRVVFVDRGAGEVTEIPLDESQSGSLQVHLEGGSQGGVLVVVATARHTWLSVPYQISLEP